MKFSIDDLDKISGSKEFIKYLQEEYKKEKEGGHENCTCDAFVWQLLGFLQEEPEKVRNILEADS